MGAIAAALRFPALFNIWTMGGGHALLAVSRVGSGRVACRWLKLGSGVDAASVH